MFPKVFTRVALAAALFVGLSQLPATAQSDLNFPVDTPAITVGASITPLIAASVSAIAGVQPFKEVTFAPDDGVIAIGGPAVTTASGQKLAAGERWTVEWSRGRNYCAIRISGSPGPVRVLPVK